MNSPSASEVTVYFNPRCSKSRAARDLLEGQGVDANLYEYLKEAPTRDDVEHVMNLLRIADPRQMMRVGEDAYRDLDLANADDEELIDAMVDHPILIERPIVIHGGEAVIARPPEKLWDLFDD